MCNSPEKETSCQPPASPQVWRPALPHPHRPNHPPQLPQVTEELSFFSEPPQRAYPTLWCLRPPWSSPGWRKGSSPRPSQRRRSREPPHGFPGTQDLCSHHPNRGRFHIPGPRRKASANPADRRSQGPVTGGDLDSCHWPALEGFPRHSQDQKS